MTGFQTRVTDKGPTSRGESRRSQFLVSGSLLSQPATHAVVIRESIAICSQKFVGEATLLVGVSGLGMQATSDVQRKTSMDSSVKRSSRARCQVDQRLAWNQPPLLAHPAQTVFRFSSPVIYSTWYRVTRQPHDPHANEQVSG